jgi:predicted ester cyclase
MDVSEENKAVVRRLIEEVYNHDRLDLLDELVAQDVINHTAVAHHRHGIEGFRHVVEWARTNLDMVMTIEEVIAEGDRVAVRIRADGTPRGAVFGMEPTGKSFSVEHVHWHRLAEGKLVERWAVRDDLGVLQQLGVIPPPGRPEEADSTK